MLLPVPDWPKASNASAAMSYVPSTIEGGVGQIHWKVVRADVVGFTLPWTTPSMFHCRSSARELVVAVKETDEPLRIVGPTGFETRLLTAGANALPGLLITPCWRAVRVCAPSRQVTSITTRL